MISYGLSDFLKSDFLFHVHCSVVICDFLVESSQITIVLMHVSFKIHYRNNLIDKKHSYLIPRPPSWDGRNCSYGHQLYSSNFFLTRNFRPPISILNLCKEILNLTGFVNYKKGALDLQPQVIKFTSCLPRVAVVLSRYSSFLHH